MKLELLNRALMAAALTALAIMLGVWLTRTPLTAAPASDAAPADQPADQPAAPAKPPVKTHPAKPFMPMPVLAPLPVDPPALAIMPTTVAPTTTIEVEISYEIAPPPVVADPPPSSTKIMAFTATWCEPCRRAKPRLVEIEKSGIKVESIDIDRQPRVARQYSIRRVPTFLVFAGNKIILRTNDMEAVVAKVKTNGVLGITLDAETARIKTIRPGSAAERAALKLGDIITKINDDQTPTPADLITAVRRHLPGATVCLKVRRDASILALTTTLDTPR